MARKATKLGSIREFCTIAEEKVDGVKNAVKVPSLNADVTIEDISTAMGEDTVLSILRSGVNARLKQNAVNAAKASEDPLKNLERITKALKEAKGEERKALLQELRDAQEAIC